MQRAQPGIISPHWRIRRYTDFCSVFAEQLYGRQTTVREMNQLLTGSGASEKKTRASNTFGMTGNLILEIPEQKGPIPQSVIDYANNKGIIIRDVNGKEYN